MNPQASRSHTTGVDRHEVGCPYDLEVRTCHHAQAQTDSNLLSQHPGRFRKSIRPRGLRFLMSRKRFLARLDVHLVVPFVFIHV